MNRIYVSIYSLFVLILFSASGYSDSFTFLLEKSENSKNLSNLTLSSLIQTDFGYHVLQYILVLLIFILILDRILIAGITQLEQLINGRFNPIWIQLLTPIFFYLAIFTINSKLFYYSLHNYNELRIAAWYSPAVLIGFSVLAFCLFASLKSLVNYLIPRKKLSTALAIFVLIPAISGFFSTTFEAQQHNKPNVIFIGVDSLRQEFVPEHMPFLHSKLKSSTLYENTYTPFARTFPSWSTILSGSFPPSHGAHFNLINEQLLNPNTRYLPQVLKKEGYQTVYASDERRFSQLGRFHGMDNIIGPRTGLGDFVLGNYADHPITNILSYFQFSQKLLPELTINRAASHIYVPKNFSSSLANSLQTLDSGSPLFLSVHYCLAHWPFHYGNFNPSNLPNNANIKIEGYKSSLMEVDNQIKHLWNNLEQSGLLENSIVVFLSDHGESWNETLSFAKQNGEHYHHISNGHGNNVVSNNEHQVLLGFYNHNGDHQNIPNTATLADIYPTILGKLNLQSPHPMDGRDLSKDIPLDTIFPVESGFTVSAASSTIEPEKAAMQAMKRYTILGDGQLRIKVDEVPFLKSGKFRAVRNNHSMLTIQRLTHKSSPSPIVLNYNQKTVSALDLEKPLHKELHQHFCHWYPETITDFVPCP